MYRLTFINNNTEFAIALVRAVATISNMLFAFLLGSRETRLSRYRCRCTPRNPKTYINGGHIGRAFINNNDQSARAPIAISSLCRLDSLAVDSNRPAHSPRRSDMHILEHRNRDMTRRAPLVITAINPIGHFAGSRCDGAFVRRVQFSIRRLRSKSRRTLATHHMDISPISFPTISPRK